MPSLSILYMAYEHLEVGYKTIQPDVSLPSNSHFRMRLFKCYQEAVIRIRQLQHYKETIFKDVDLSEDSKYGLLVGELVLCYRTVAQQFPLLSPAKNLLNMLEIVLKLIEPNACDSPDIFNINSQRFNEAANFVERTKIADEIRLLTLVDELDSAMSTAVDRAEAVGVAQPLALSEMTPSLLQLYRAYYQLEKQYEKMQFAEIPAESCHEVITQIQQLTHYKDTLTRREEAELSDDDRYGLLLGQLVLCYRAIAQQFPLLSPFENLLQLLEIAITSVEPVVCKSPGMFNVDKTVLNWAAEFAEQKNIAYPELLTEVVKKEFPMCAELERIQVVMQAYDQLINHYVAAAELKPSRYRCLRIRQLGDYIKSVIGDTTVLYENKYPLILGEFVLCYKEIQAAYDQGWTASLFPQTCASQHLGKLLVDAILALEPTARHDQGDFNPDADVLRTAEELLQQKCNAVIYTHQI